MNIVISPIRVGIQNRSRHPFDIQFGRGQNGGDIADDAAVLRGSQIAAVGVRSERWILIRKLRHQKSSAQHHFGQLVGGIGGIPAKINSSRRLCSDDRAMNEGIGKVGEYDQSGRVTPALRRVGRIRREGQKETCIYRYYVAVFQNGKDTVDRHCLDLLDDKVEVMSRFHNLSKKELANFF